MTFFASNDSENNLVASHFRARQTDVAVRRNSGFADCVLRPKVPPAVRHLPAPANETRPQKKLLSSFIAAPTAAAASADLPHS